MKKNELIEYINLAGKMGGYDLSKMPENGFIYFDNSYQTVDEAIKNGELGVFNEDFEGSGSREIEELYFYTEYLIKSNFDGMKFFEELVDWGIIDVDKLIEGFKKYESINHFMFEINKYNDNEEIDWIETKYSLEELRDIVNEKNRKEQDDNSSMKM